MSQLKVLAVSSLENAAVLEELLECEDLNRMATLQPAGENLDRAASFPVDAVVVLSHEMTPSECDFVERLYMSRGKLAFVLICEAAEAGILSRAMSCGIMRVLTADMGKERVCKGIRDEIARVQNRTDSAEIREYDSRVISVFSTKGGSGKTTLAVNLAAALQKAGKRVVLVDADLQFGDVGVFMNLPRRDTISDLVSESNLNASTVNSFLVRHRSGVDVLCAPVSPELAELVKSEHIERIVTVLRSEYDYVILDTAPLLDDINLTALEQSDTIYFVTTPEIPTLKNTRICIGILRTLNYADRIRLVLNREGDPYVKRRDVKVSLELEPVLCIPNDSRHASGAVNRGIPVVTASPRSRISKAITRFVEKGGV